MKRTPLTRNTPLRRRTPVLDGQPTRAVAGRRRARNTGPTPVVRKLVIERDDHRCIICGVPIDASPMGWSLQHRVARGSGGTRRPEINQPQNLVTLCGDGARGCHGEVEDRPNWARLYGYRVDRGTDPAAVPVWYPQARQWRLLRPDGNWTLGEGP